MHGLVRNLLKNDLIGLSTGFAKVLVISGVGYKAEVKGKSLVLTLGYSTPIEYPMPEGITIEVEADTRVTVTGADRQQRGADRLRDPVVPPHGALQGQGHPVRHRVRPSQGRQERDQVERGDTT